MSAPDLSAIDTEEKWIAKYRSALDAAPAQQPRKLKLREVINVARDFMISIAGSLLGGIGTKPRSLPSNSKPANLRRRTPKMIESVPPPAEESLSKKAG